MTTSERKWTVCIFYGENAQPDVFRGSKLLDRDEGYFGMLRFADANGVEHLVSVAQAFTAHEERD